MKKPKPPLAIFRWLILCWTIAALLLILPACGALPGPAQTPNPITCNAAYRSSTGVSIEREESVAFGEEDAVESIKFADLTFNVQYSSGEMNNERALRLWVTDAGRNVELLSQLYQLPQDSGPLNQFVGGHGFTGLNYAYHPTTGAELQFWCTAD